MKNFKQPGKVLTVIAPTDGFKSGDLIQQNDLIGVAAIDAHPVNGSQRETEMALNGVFRVAKATSLVINQGEKLYAAFTGQVADAVNKTSSARIFVGWAAKAALSNDTVVEMLLPLGGE